MLVENKIKKIHTSCKDCVWGVYENQNSKTQLDCSLELVEYYKNKKTEILECFNKEDEFFVINGRKCYFKRNKEWWAKFGDGIDHISKVFEETHIKYMTIIIGDNDFDELSDIKLTLNSILEQKIQPSFIIVIRKYNSTIDVKELNKELIKTGKKWRVSTPSKPEISPDSIIDSLINMFWEKYPVYLKMDAGKVLFNEEMTNLNNSIIFDDFKFGLIPISDKCCIANSFLHNFFKGNFPPELIKKYDN